MIFRILKTAVLIGSITLISACELLQIHMKDDIADLEAIGFVQSKVFLREGGSMSYWRAGQGSPLIFIHGFSGDSIATWKQEMTALKDDYDVIAVDLPWFGDSFSAGQANLTTVTDAVTQVIDKLGLNQVNIIGSSYGGLVAFNMLSTPDKIDKVIIIASPGPYFNDNDLIKLKTRLDIKRTEDLFVPQDLDQLRRLLTSTGNSASELPSFVLDQMYQDNFTAWHKQRIAMIKSLRSDRDRLLRDETLRNPEVEIPDLMLIWGENDQVFPLKNGIKFSKKIQAPLIILPNAGHAIAIEQAPAVIHSIRSFID